MDLIYNCKLCKMRFSNHYELNGHNTKHRKECNRMAKYSKNY